MAAVGLAAAGLVVPVLERRPGFVVVAKPAGLVVHRNDWSRRGSLALVQLVRDQLGVYVHPVHRLDAGTSGCLIFAEDAATTAMLQRAMSADTATKTYYAMVRGNARADLGETLNMAREIADDKGVRRAAETELWCPAGCFTEDLPEHVAHTGVAARINRGCSLVVARPKTGRWHQIRKHLGSLSHPILNDASHGDTRVNRWWREQWGMRHLGLHCAELQLELENGERLHVKCPPRAELTRVWQQMPWWEDAQRALPLLGEEDPWTPGDIAELDRLLEEVDEYAQQRAEIEARIAAAREKRSAWGGKRVKTIESTVVFVQPDAFLNSLANFSSCMYGCGPMNGTSPMLAVDLAGDVPCEITGREVRPARPGESGKFVRVRPLLSSLAHLEVAEIHVTDLVPMHAWFRDAWARHGEVCIDEMQGDHPVIEENSENDSDGSNVAEGNDHGVGMRRALIEAIKQQQAAVATRVSPAELFSSFAPEFDVPLEIASCTPYKPDGDRG